MKHIALLIGLILLTHFSFGQKTDYSNDWIKQLENPNYSTDSLIKDNKISKYVSYDFSSLIIPKQDFLGFIGQDYKRIKIYFTAVSKDVNNSKLYHVIGQSIVDNNNCDFIGSIIITQIREFKLMHLGLDDQYKDSSMKVQGVVIGSYDIKENPKQKNSGIFQGVMTTYWYINKDSKLIYDKIEWYSDSYNNNQYIGVWKSYSNKIEKICNWGEYRIPFSGDLDIGTAEFSPNPKYLDKGWRDLKLK